MKGASVGSGDAALDHDLVVWFGDFHSSIAGFEPVSFGSDSQSPNCLCFYDWRPRMYSLNACGTIYDVTGAAAARGSWTEVSCAK